MAFTGKNLEHVLSRSLTSGRRPYAARSSFPGPVVSAPLRVPTGQAATEHAGPAGASGGLSVPERPVRATSGVAAELTAALRAARQMCDWEAALSAVQLVCHDHTAATGGGAAPALTTPQLALLFATLREADLRLPPLPSPDPLTPIAVAGSGASSSRRASGATPRLNRALDAIDRGAPMAPGATPASTVAALAEAGAWQGALARFTRTAEAPVAAPAAAEVREALNACISACAQPGQWEAAMRLAARPMRLRAQLGAAAAVRAVGAAAPTAAQDIEAVGPVADAVTYAALVSVLEACGRREELKQVLALAPPADRASIDASYVALIDVWSGRHAAGAMRRF